MYTYRRINIKKIIHINIMEKNKRSIYEKERKKLYYLAKLLMYHNVLYHYLIILICLIRNKI